MDFATLASASFLSKEDRRAYLIAMERDAKAAATRGSQQIPANRKPR